MRAKASRSAQEMLEGGRVQEGLHRYQDALDAYFAILALAPESPAATGAEDGIDRRRNGHDNAIAEFNIVRG